MVTVLTFGTFDVVHEGHKEFLKQAKEWGDKLVVIVARDSNVKKLKGFLPKDDEQTRLRNVQALPCVDIAKLGDENLDNRFRWLDEYSPEVICVGYDQGLLSLEQELHKRTFHINLVRLNAHHPDTYKSSKLRGKQE